MKQFKLDILQAMEKLSKEYHSFKLKTAAEQTERKRLTQSESREIIRAFCKKHSEYKPYLLSDNPKESFFNAVFVSDNESIPED